MLKKILMSGLLMLAFTTVEAGDFSPFGIKIGEPLTKAPSNINAEDYFRVKAPNPYPPIFDKYFVRFDSTNQVQYVRAVGNINSKKYQCKDMATILKDNFVKEYPQYTDGSRMSQNSFNVYSFAVKNKDDLYVVDISCSWSEVSFEMYNIRLKPKFSNDPDLTKYELKL